MTQVKIVYVPTSDRRAPDLSRIGRIEDIDPDVARRMVQEGTATIPSPEDYAAEAAEAAHPEPDAPAEVEQPKRAKRTPAADEPEQTT